MDQFLVLKLEFKKPLVTLLDLLQLQDLFILQLPVLAFKVSGKADDLIELLITLTFNSPRSHDLRFENFYLL